MTDSFPNSDLPLPDYLDDSLFCHDLPSAPRPQIGTILVTGASGYIGGRLVPELLARGYRVRAMVRAASPEYAARWPGAQIVVADALRPADLDRALEGVHTAYYLIHSLLLGPENFSAADLLAAANFRRAAHAAGAARIIYLGGLGDARGALSPHLHSRMKVAQALAGGHAAVTVLRAAIIIGSGSASYEIISHLARKLFLVPIPRWARNKCQPIAIRDVIKYLVGVLETPETGGHQYDIGGPDILSYEQMLRVMADMLGRKRLYVFLPVDHVALFGYIASLVTPVPAPITLSLMAGLAGEVVCGRQDIRSLIPFCPLGYRQAIVRAMSREEQDQVRTRWSDAYPPAHELAVKLHELRHPARYTGTAGLVTDKSPAAIFKAVCRIGGRQGWFHNNWLWRLRGGIDRLLLGVGDIRGRRRLSALEINDVVGFWRVEDLRPDARLLLRAEMKLPGKAWLEFTIAPAHNDPAQTSLAATAYFDTASPGGHLYWYLLLPFHHFIFDGLIRQIEKHAR
ncbi:MAG: SDR family oxidoreductase [Planctomycetota bacterium]|nr:SDR family oxidoreductase [Planctomycetota bacterium]